MKTTKLVFKALNILFLLLIIRTQAQTNVNGKLTDTLRTSVDTFLNDELSRSLSNPNSLYRSFSDFPNQNNISIDTSSVWLQARMQLGETMNEDPVKSNFKANILNPLRQQFSDIESMKVIKYILATVQVGAVGYLAYQHIKKYGFLKK